MAFRWGVWSARRVNSNSGDPVFHWALLYSVNENGYKWTGLCNYPTEKSSLLLSVNQLMLAGEEEKVTTLLLGIHMESSMRTTAI